VATSSARACTTPPKPIAEDGGGLRVHLVLEEPAQRALVEAGQRGTGQRAPAGPPGARRRLRDLGIPTSGRGRGGLSGRLVVGRGGQPGQPTRRRGGAAGCWRVDGARRSAATSDGSDSGPGDALEVLGAGTPSSDRKRTGARPPRRAGDGGHDDGGARWGAT
jgi:hypothetical protein